MRTHLKVVGLVNLLYSALGMLAALGVLFGSLSGALSTLNPIAIIVGTLGIHIPTDSRREGNGVDPGETGNVGNPLIVSQFLAANFLGPAVSRGVDKPIPLVLELGVGHSRIVLADTEAISLFREVANDLEHFVAVFDIHHHIPIVAQGSGKVNTYFWSFLTFFRL